MDVEDNVGTSSVQIDETIREDVCEFTGTELVSYQANKGLSIEGQIEQSKELITRLPNKEDIIESNKKTSLNHVLLSVLLKLNSEKVSLN